MGSAQASWTALLQFLDAHNWLWISPGAVKNLDNISQINADADTFNP